MKSPLFSCSCFLIAFILMFFVALNGESTSFFHLYVFLLPQSQNCIDGISSDNNQDGHIYDGCARFGLFFCALILGIAVYTLVSLRRFESGTGRL